MQLDPLLSRIFKQTRSRHLLTAGFLALLVMNAIRVRLKEKALARGVEAEFLSQRLSDSTIALNDNFTLQELKARDLAAFKMGLSQLAQSRRAIYEGGLQLQEEKRLLEKQWEIMTTYLMVDEEAKKIHLMRGEQSLESFTVLIATPQAYGGQNQPPPALVAVVSKERFAHPERGKSEEVNGQLQWEPPQVGTSVRSNALGEYVMFTKSSLILHGPPKKNEEHNSFPHYCLNLSWDVARRLYAKSYVGSKIIFKAAPKPLALQNPKAK